MFRLVIAVPATSHPSKHGGEGARGIGGWMSIRECVGYKRTRIHSYTRASPGRRVGVPSNPRVRACKLLFHVAVSSTYFDVLEWARLRAVPAGSPERMKSSTCDPAMCFPITLNRPTQGIPMEYRRRKQAMGIVKRVA